MGLEKKLKTGLEVLALAGGIMYNSEAKADDIFTYNPDNIDPYAAIGAVTAFNVGANAIICGSIAVGKDKDFDEILMDSLLCAGGGGFHTFGMFTGSLSPYTMGLGNQFVSLGNDFINNTLQDRWFLEEVHYNFGPANISFNTLDGSLDAYWSILSLAGIVVNAAEGNKFSIKDSLLAQTFVFHTPDDYGNQTGVRGKTIGNTFSYNPKYSPIMFHENMHRYRFNTLQVTQTLAKEALPEGDAKDAIEWIERNTRIQAVPDLLWAGLTAPQIICNLTSDDCGFKGYDWLEWEANALPKVNPDFTSNKDLIDMREGR